MQKTVRILIADDHVVVRAGLRALLERTSNFAVVAEASTGEEAVRPCDYPPDTKLNISGTRLREMFANHEAIPAEFSRPEVVEVLQAYYDEIS